MVGAGAGIGLSRDMPGIDMIRKQLDLIVVAFVVLALMFYDLTIELLRELIHLVFEAGFNLFEWLELGIEHTVEHLFHTSHHGSQIVTFYVLLSIAGFLFYRLWQALPRFYTHLKQTLLEFWVRRKTQWELYWLSLTLSNKIVLIGTALGVAYLASFFVM